MKKFKLINQIPGLTEIGTMATEIVGKPRQYKLRCGGYKNGWVVPAEDVELWPEFWKEIK